MITEDYVSFETAKLLKEKGFDESISMVYMSYGHLRKLNRYDSIRNSNYNDITKNYFEYTAPTLQMAMKWLREEKKMGIEINTNFDLDDDSKWHYEYGFCIFQLSGSFEKCAECDYDGYKTYEEACEAAIQYCLKNLI